MAAKTLDFDIEVIEVRAADPRIVIGFFF